MPAVQHGRAQMRGWLRVCTMPTTSRTHLVRTPCPAPCLPAHTPLPCQTSSNDSPRPPPLLPPLLLQMSEPVGDFLRGNGWRESPRWQPSSPRFGGVAAEFGIRSPETLPRVPSLAYCTLQVGDGAASAMHAAAGYGAQQAEPLGFLRCAAACAPGATVSHALMHMFARAPCCNPPTPLQSRFGDVLDTLVARHLHRLFICDADMRPAGVLSCTDILRLVAAEPD